MLHDSRTASDGMAMRLGIVVGGAARAQQQRGVWQDSSTSSSEDEILVMEELIIGTCAGGHLHSCLDDLVFIPGEAFGRCAVYAKRFATSTLNRHDK